jgi:hypothetical protein
MKLVISSRCVIVGALGVVALLASPAMAVAQVEAGGSFQVLHDRQVTLPRGWQVSLGAGVTPRWTLAGDVSGSIRPSGTFNLKALAFLAGPKFLFNDHGTVTGFGQMLLGAQRDSTNCCGGTPINVTDRHTFLAVQPGIGADVHVARHLAARLEIDLRLVRRFGTIGSSPRYLMGMVVK